MGLNRNAYMDIAKRLVEVARKEGATAICHGATGESFVLLNHQKHHYVFDLR